MDKTDIVSAAFRAWGREMYRTMSLTDVASELGVTKPALYRHFRDKNVLLDAMDQSFFDRYAAELGRAGARIASEDAGDPRSILAYVGAIADYFGRNREDLAFLFGRIMPASAPDSRFAAELRARGIPVADPQAGGPERWVPITSSITSAFLFVALFHIARGKGAGPASDTEIAGLVAGARGACARGLGFPPGAAESVDYAALDRLAALSPEETAAPDGLLPAVASAVAEVGAWKATMAMVAQRSGLSKSGLYAHFDSKEEMLTSLFETEFDRIAAAMEARCSRAADAPSKLYLAAATAASYLLARPDVLTALDWVRTQRFELRQLLSTRMAGVFGFLEEGAVAGGNILLPGGLQSTVRWILFLAVHQIVPCRDRAPEDAVRRLRALHSFLLNGVGGA